MTKARTKNMQERKMMPMSFTLYPETAPPMGCNRPKERVPTIGCLNRWTSVHNACWPATLTAADGNCRSSMNVPASAPPGNVLSHWILLQELPSPGPVPRPGGIPSPFPCLDLTAAPVRENPRSVTGGAPPRHGTEAGDLPSGSQSGTRSNGYHIRPHMPRHHGDRPSPCPGQTRNHPIRNCALGRI